MAGRAMEPDVCVVGAGLAGLTSARRLPQAGQSVAVLEARDRVGGRVWTWTSADGVPVDMGGCSVGPHHERRRALAKETGVSNFKTFVDGDNMLATGGAPLAARSRYRHARLLAQSTDSNDHNRARRLLRTAGATAGALGMALLEKQADELYNGFDPRDGESASGS